MPAGKDDAPAPAAAKDNAQQQPRTVEEAVRTAPPADNRAVVRTSDAKSVPGEAVPMGQPAAAVGALTDPTSLHPEGDTAVHNAGNASMVRPSPAPLIGTSEPPAGSMPVNIDPQPNPWPIAPQPVDAKLVSPTGVPMRSAHQEAAVSHLTMRLGELRNFLGAFNHYELLDGPLLELVSALKDALGLPHTPEEMAYLRGLPVATAANSGVVSTSMTSAGSPAQGSYGPGAVKGAA